MSTDEWDHPTMTREQFAARLAELSAEAAIAEAEQIASGHELPYWWLSFCDASLPTGSQFLGACIVQGATQMAAVGRSHALAVNPGGEVAMHGPIDAETFSAEYREQWCDRLLTKDEATNIPSPSL